MPPGAGADSLVEAYHQESLDSGSRIRENLSRAVEDAIKCMADGFLNHPANLSLRQEIQQGNLHPGTLYQYLLRFIYRLLFLMVIEERRLIYDTGALPLHKDTYYRYYSVSQLRKRCESLRAMQEKYTDLWTGLNQTFRLFEEGEKGRHLGIKPLSGQLFAPGALGILMSCKLENRVLLQAMNSLSLFRHKDSHQKMRVNYGSLNVEEFGSVYEGLLDYTPVVVKQSPGYQFVFQRGTERSASGSHYTPDELVQPLIRHSLDHAIAEKLEHSAGKDRKAAALLSIKACDATCGSGHILLSAARRIGTELARVRTGEDQPSPPAIREGIRDAITHCIYGVDKNPLAVELCKVALWLEAHTPGQPLNFLDHRIKCGDAIVGLAHKEELELGIPDEAFNKMPGDDPEVVREFGRRNRTERKESLAKLRDYTKVYEPMNNITALFQRFDALPERTVPEIKEKEAQYKNLVFGPHWNRIKSLADLRIAQFFIPKTRENAAVLVTDSDYREFLRGYENVPVPQEEAARRVAGQRRFFHWFLEFPDVFINAGFDCILGNPPFLGNRKIKSALGPDYLEWVKYCYAPAGAIEMVGYFFRRIFNLIKPSGFQALIATNTIAQGAAREGGLEVIEKNGGALNFAIRSMKWPGVAAVEVSLISIFKGKWVKKFILNGKEVEIISAYLDDSKNLSNPFTLEQNVDKSFQGSIVLGKGFILTPEKARELIGKNEKNKDVLFPYLNGEDLNSRPDQSPSRWVINFFDWTEKKAMDEYPDCFEIIERLVKPERQRKDDKGEYILRKPLPQRWWHYADKRPLLYKTIESLERVLVVAQVSKTLAFNFVKNDKVLDAKLIVFSIKEFKYFAILQSSLHSHWAWKYCTTMKTDLTYTPTYIFETFPFPQGVSETMEKHLELLGETYHQHRRQLMLSLQLGLTKIYNLFHKKNLSPQDIISETQTIKDPAAAETALQNLLKLRDLHKQMDLAVLEAYGWTDINPAHDFYDVDYLPENDQTRFTISPQARKETLERLLLLNHRLHAQEIEQETVLTPWKSKKTREKERGQENSTHSQKSLF